MNTRLVEPSQVRIGDFVESDNQWKRVHAVHTGFGGGVWFIHFEDGTFLPSREPVRVRHECAERRAG
jgi:hypothetical protein